MIVFAAFVILSALLLWAVIYGRGHWLLKLALIVTVPLFAFVVRDAINSYSGYPLHSPPPRSAQLVGYYAQEPRWIYVFAIPKGSSEPRSYRIPYNRKTHSALAALAASGDQRPMGIRPTGPQGRFVPYALPNPIPSKEN